VDLIRRDEEELGLGVDELANQPRAGDAVYLDVLAGDPFHIGLQGSFPKLEASGKLSYSSSRSKSSS
jgi:hypothetical protein